MQQFAEAKLRIWSLELCRAGAGFALRNKAIASFLRFCSESDLERPLRTTNDQKGHFPMMLTKQLRYEDISGETYCIHVSQGKFSIEKRIGER